MQLTISKMDSKGRISLPAHVRDFMGIKAGDTIALVTNSRKEISVVASPDHGDTVIVKATMNNLHIGMKKIVDVLDSHKIALLSLESFTLERGKRFGCIATLELDGFRDLNILRKDIKGADVDDVEISAYQY